MLVTYTTQEVRLIPLMVKTLKMVKNFLWNYVFSGNEALTLQVVAVGCVGTFCRKLSDFF